MKAEVINWSKIAKSDVEKGVTRQVYSTKNVMIVKYTYSPNAVYKEHAHPQEQITLIEKGEIVFKVGDEEMILKEDDICFIPPNVLHSAKVLRGRVETINIFYPVKEEFLNEESS